MEVDDCIERFTALDVDCLAEKTRRSGFNVLCPVDRNKMALLSKEDEERKHKVELGKLLLERSLSTRKRQTGRFARFEGTGSNGQGGDGHVLEGIDGGGPGGHRGGGVGGVETSAKETLKDLDAFACRMLSLSQHALRFDYPAAGLSLQSHAT